MGKHTADLDDEEPQPRGPKYTAGLIPRPKAPPKGSSRAVDPVVVLDSRELFVPTPGKEGAPIAGRVHLTMKAQIQELIQSRRTKFRLEGDVVRAALTWFLQDEGVLEALGIDRFDSRVKEMRDYLDSCANEALRLDLKEFKRKVGELVSNMLELEMLDEAIEEFERAQAKAKNYGDESRFYQHVLQWMNTAPEFGEVRRAIRAQEPAPKLIKRGRR